MVWHANFFVCDAGVDANEQLMFCCQWCWRELVPNSTEKSFRKAARASWKRRSNNAKQLERIYKHQEIGGDTLRQEGETLAAHREHILKGCRLAR